MLGSILWKKSFWPWRCSSRNKKKLNEQNSHRDHDFSNNKPRMQKCSKGTTNQYTGCSYVMIISDLSFQFNLALRLLYKVLQFSLSRSTRTPVPHHDLLVFLSSFQKRKIDLVPSGHP